MISTIENMYAPQSYNQLFNMAHAVPLAHLSAMIGRDPGLPMEKKQPLLTMLNTPEVYDHLLAGAAGAALALTVAKFTELDKAPKALVGLAGFGIGNVVYNLLKENKFTHYDPQQGTSTLRY